MAKAKETDVQPIQPGVVPEVYANAALVSTSPYEFEITLGLGSANYEGVRPVVNLRMSPQFAREFAQLLVDNVHSYQEQFGEPGKEKKN